MQPHLHDAPRTRRSSRSAPWREEARDRPRRIDDIRQWLGMSGDGLGTSGTLGRTFLYSCAIAAVIVGVLSTANVVTLLHDESGDGFAGPVIREGSSRRSLMEFFPIIWIARRLAPAGIRPRCMQLVHIPCALPFALRHVGGFVVLRKIVYRLAGAHHDFGAFLPNYHYELRKDTLA